MPHINPVPPLVVTPRSSQGPVRSRSASVLGAGGGRAARAPRPYRSCQGVEARAVSTPVLPSEDELLAVVSAAVLLLRWCSCLDRGLDLQDAERLFVQHQLLP